MASKIFGLNDTVSEQLATGITERNRGLGVLPAFGLDPLRGTWLWMIQLVCEARVKWGRGKLYVVDLSAHAPELTGGHRHCSGALRRYTPHR